MNYQVEKCLTPRVKNSDKVSLSLNILAISDKPAATVRSRVLSAPRTRRNIDKKGKYLRNILRHTDEVHSGVY